MRMKRTIALLLALMLAVGLMGCSKEEKNISGQVTPVTEALLEDKPVTLGRIEGGVYTNEYIGIGCTLDADWTFYTAEELQELPGQIHEELKDTEYSDAGLRQIADMFAENTVDGSNINIQYTKLNLQERMVFAAMDYEGFVDMILRESESMAAAYAQSGFENVKMEKVIVNYLGQERVAIRTTATVMDVPLYMLQLFEHDLGQYYVVITVTAVAEDTVQSLTDLFYSLD